MIASWGNSRSRRFYEEGKVSKFRGLDIDSADELLAALDSATSLKDLSPLKSIGLHKLSGDGAGQWAMTANGPWRICFRFKNGNAYDVEITDYHKG
jgi:proteic killer suppression protein